MGLPVLGPDINESYRSFAVNKKGEIRFGLAAIKGTGDAAVDSIIEERDKNGAYKDIFDFVKRVNLRTVNKKTIESLAYGGGFDCFEEAQGLHRAIYFADVEGSNFIEKIIKYANKSTEIDQSSQGSLFGMLGDAGGGKDFGGGIGRGVIPWVRKASPEGLVLVPKLCLGTQDSKLCFGSVCFCRCD